MSSVLMARNLISTTWRILNAATEKTIASFLHPYLPTPHVLSLPSLSPSSPITSSNILDFNKDFGILYSKRRQGDIMTSEYIEEEDRSFMSRSDRDLKQEKLLDFRAECPRWLMMRKGREWRPVLPRFIEGVVVDLQTRKPKKPNSGNRRVARVQIKIQGRTKVVTARIRGEKNTLQQHHRVLVQYCRARNLPTVKWVVVRGQLDAQY